MDQSVFPSGSKPTVRENRATSMTCRTWLLQVLEVLEEEGFMVRESGIEGIVSTRDKCQAGAEVVLFSFVA